MKKVVAGLGLLFVSSFLIILGIYCTDVIAQKYERNIWLLVGCLIFAFGLILSLIGSFYSLFRITKLWIRIPCSLLLSVFLLFVSIDICSGQDVIRSVSVKIIRKVTHKTNNNSPKNRVGYILVNKTDKTLKLLTKKNGNVIKTYNIELGKNPKGPKQFQGDLKTPEGIYHIIGKHPTSIAHKGLYLSYPNAKDKAFAKLNGRNAGGCIMIHGLKNGTAASKQNKHPGKNWTGGCIAVTNTEIDEIYDLVKVGIKVEIIP